jgi:hypothetical protein
VGYLDKNHVLAVRGEQQDARRPHPWHRSTSLYRMLGVRSSSAPFSHWAARLGALTPSTPSLIPGTPPLPFAPA